MKREKEKGKGEETKEIEEENKGNKKNKRINEK